jgi:hypothetical protein
MAFTLIACVAPPPSFARCVRGPDAGPPVDLGFGLQLVLFSGGRDFAGERHPIFEQLTPPIAAWLREVARQGPMAYLEAVYWAGVGWQAAAVWEEGRLVLGPLFHTSDSDDAARAALASPAPGGAINAALIRLGVTPMSGLDAFETVGLLGIVRRRR